MNVRVACAQILAAVIRGEASLNTLLPAYSGKVPERDTALLQELCFGTLRHYPALAALLELLLEKPLKAKDGDVQALLLSGLYQIREMRTPSHAAVNESVAATKALKKPWARGLINGVLRRYLREREAIDLACENNDDYRSLHPDWLREAIEAAWPMQAGDIMAANNLRPPMTLRANCRLISRDEYLAELAARGISARSAPFADHGIYLDRPCDVTELPGFVEGLVSVQDEAAQLCGQLLAPGPGHRVLDACSAPGGKTCHILERHGELQELVALEIDPGRLGSVGENLARLQLSATLQAADATRLDQWWDGKPFDCILLDAPCSATGVIRRHPDIKLLRRHEDIAKLAALQGQLLGATWQTLKPGGRLLYATCSVLPMENDEVVGAFVSRQSDCEVVPIDAHWGLATVHGRQLLPQPAGHDGFYYALLEKRIER